MNIFEKVLPALITVLQKDTVTSVPMPMAPKAAKEVINAVQDSPDIAIVPVKSAWTSKLNWKSGLALIAAASAIFGIDVTPAQQVAILGGIVAVSEIAGVIIKTFFSNSVTAASAGKS